MSQSEPTDDELRAAIRGVGLRATRGRMVVLGEQRHDHRGIRQPFESN